MQKQIAIILFTYLLSVCYGLSISQLNRNPSDQTNLSHNSISGPRQMDSKKKQSENKKTYFNNLSETVEGPSKIRTFSIGLDHTCVLNELKVIYCWGDNSDGRLGLGDTLRRHDASSELPPVDIGYQRKAKDFCLGQSFTCAHLETNDVLCWGKNDKGQLGIGSKTTIGDNPDEMGDILQTIDFGAGRKVKKLSCGVYNACAILDNDKLKCWGANSVSYPLGIGDTFHRGDDANEMGDNLPYVELGGKVIDISKSEEHTCVLLDIGVKCFGYNIQGECGYGDKLARGHSATTVGENLPLVDIGDVTVAQVTVGRRTSCVILDTGDAKCWGENGIFPGAGKLGYGDNIARFSTGQLGNNLPTIDFGAGLKVQSISGYYGFYALLSDGTVKAWGVNFYCSLPSENGQNYGVGVGAYPDDMGDNLPSLRLPGNKKVKKVESGLNHACVQLEDDSLTCFGNNQDGQLGIGTFDVWVGCAEGEMGDALRLIKLFECPYNSIRVEVTTDSEPESTSWGLKSLDLNNIVMQTRDGEYKISNYKYEHNACEPQGTYEFRIEHSIGEWDGSYRLSLNGEILKAENISGYFFEDSEVFSKCDMDRYCDDQDICTSNVCDMTFGECIFKLEFSSHCRSVGNPVNLIIRGESLDSSMTSSVNELRDSFFGTEGKDFNMKSQFSACSYNKFDINLYNSTTTNIYGVTTVKLLENTNGLQASYVADKLLEEARIVIQEDFDRFDELGFLILCLPPGTLVGDSQNWKAYAFIHSYLSVYNDENCIFTSVQMHETGHNIGLSHSNDDANYGDHSGYMGVSYGLTDGPLKCFNSPKSWQLGWFDESFLILALEDLLGRYVELLGASDFTKRGYKATHLKIINCQNGFDFYLAFNRNTNMNIGTTEGINQVMITQQEIGSYYANSYLIATLDHLQKFTLYNLGSSGDVDLQITPNIFLNEDPAFAKVSFSVWSAGCLDDFDCDDGNFCTIDQCISSMDSKECLHTPKNCTDCGAPITVQILTDDFPNDITWTIENIVTSKIVQSNEYYIEKNYLYNHTNCFEYGNYKYSVSYKDIANVTLASYEIGVGDILIDNGNLSEVISTEITFSICATNVDCFDYDGCTIDFCDTTKNLCENIVLSNASECSSCNWLTIDVTTDNFAEETKWNIIDLDSDYIVLSGDPFPMEVIGNGRSKAPTRNGRRKAPTRSAGQNDSSGRTLEEDNKIYRKICMENNIKFQFLITDSFGDGICCSEGEGFYIISVQDRAVQKGGNFSSSEYITLKLSVSEAECEDNDPSTVITYDPTIATCLYQTVKCEDYGALVEVSVKTDIYADDTQWNISSKSKTELQDGMYDLAYTEYVSTKCLSYGTYFFSILDLAGDGMAYCFDNDCGYTLSIGNKTVISSDGSFDFKRSYPIGVCENSNHCNDDDDNTEDICLGEERICIFSRKSCSTSEKETVQININTDFLFSLTSWIITNNETNEVLLSGGPYVKSFTHYQITSCFFVGSYTFTVKNSAGRGFTLCDSGSCGYSILVNNSTVIESDGSFSYEKSDTFIICSNDTQCVDDDPCKSSRCNKESRTCEYEILPCSDCNKISISIDVYTDNGGPETSWELSTNKSLIAFGGVYAKNHTNYRENFCFSVGVFNFTIFDKEGNGLVACKDNLCGYSLAVNGEIVIKNDGSFMFEKTHIAGVCNEDIDCDDGNECSQDTCQISTSSCKYDKVCSNCGRSEVIVNISTDNNSVKTSWEIKDKKFNTTVAVGGPYAQQFSRYQEILCLASGDYILTVNYDKGNGTSCPSEDCGYSLSVNELVLFQNVGFNESSFFFSTLSDEIYAPNFHFLNGTQKEREIYTRVSSFAVGYYHSCASSTLGTLFCWGSNTFEQLGYEKSLDSDISKSELTPLDLNGGKVKDVFAGAFHTCVIIESDDLVCFGLNDCGQLGYGRTKNTISVQDLHRDKMKVDLGEGRKVKIVSLGYKHSCAILDNNSLKCWGSNEFFQIGYDYNFNRGDDPHEMGDALPSIDLGTEGILLNISLGSYHTCALLSVGIKCFGRNSHAQLGYGDKINRGGRFMMGNKLPFVHVGGSILKVYAGNSMTCALFSNGQAKCWGQNLFAQLGYGDKMERGGDANSMENNLPFVNIGDSNEIEALALGSYSVCALTQKVKIKCWGWNAVCSLGTGDNVDQSSVEQMRNGLHEVDLSSKNIHSIQLGFGHSCANTEEGYLFCWGLNKYNQLGNGYVENIGCKAMDLGDSLKPVELIEPLSWHIEFNKADIASTSLLNFEYNISKSITQKQFRTTIFDSSCSMRNIVGGVKVYKSNISVDPFQPFDKGLVSLKLNQSALKTSGLWQQTSNDTGEIRFCLHSELFMDDDFDVSVSYVDTMTILKIDLETGLIITSLALNLKNVHEAELETKMEVSACLCDEESSCVNNPVLGRNSEVKLCIWSPRENVYIDRINSLYFYQDGVLKLKPIEKGKSTRLTTFRSGSVGIVNTRLTTIFFESSTPSDLLISGVVEIRFNEGNEPSRLRNVRILTDDGDKYATFKLVIHTELTRIFSRIWLFLVLVTALMIVTIRFRRKAKIYYLLPSKETI